MTHRVLNMHKPKSIIHLLLSLCLLSTLLVLTLPMHVLRHWQSIARMFSQSHCGDEEDELIGLSSWRHYIWYVLCSCPYGCWAPCVLHIWNSEMKSKTDRKRKVEVKYEIFLQWITRRFLRFGPYKFWILLKLYNPHDFVAEIQLKLLNESERTLSDAKSCSCEYVTLL